jgi:hypothetical protein
VWAALVLADLQEQARDDMVAVAAGRLGALHSPCRQSSSRLALYSWEFAANLLIHHVHFSLQLGEKRRRLNVGEGNVVPSVRAKLKLSSGDKQLLEMEAFMGRSVGF